MGAGKSTVAVELAALAGVEAVDTDLLVELRSGKSVAEIFAHEGEEEFRRLELEALRGALRDSPAPVISTGGGIITMPDARHLLEAEATVVLLDVSPEVAAQRVGADAARPLLADDPLGRLRALAAERTVLYREIADVIVDVDDATPEQVVSAIDSALGGIS
jgi:shikimate kinase